MEISEERYVPMSEAKKTMSSHLKDAEPGYEQKNALDHLRKFCKLKDKEAKAMYEELDAVGRLKEKQIIMVMDGMPADAEELRMLFANEVITLSEDQRKKILDIVKKHA